MPTPKQIERLLIREEIARRRAIKEFSYFCKLAWHVVEPEVPYVHNWHVDAIGLHLEAVLDGRIRNLLINMPPRMSKSTLVSVMFPAWVWLRYPGKKFLYSSYAQSLSIRDSIKCRRLMESEWYIRFFKVDWAMNSDQNTQGEFSNTRQGVRIATSVDASGTGKGGDIIVCDDPHKATDVYSDTKRESAITWWDMEMSTRSINPKTVARIIVMQRLHPEDLSGHVLARGGYVHLKLPMEYEGDTKETSIGWRDPRTEIGELLSPGRFGPPEVAQLKIDLGSHGYAGQEQQNPTAVEGAYIKRSWFRYYKELPWDVRQHTASWDFASSEKTSADYTVGLVGCRRGSDIYLIDMIRDRMEFPTACQALISFSAKHPKALKKLVEDKSAGIAIIQQLKRTVTGIVAVSPKNDKLSRLIAVSPVIEAGNVYLPESAPWVSDFLNELCGFAGEGSGNDDIVDACVYLLQDFITTPAMSAPIGIRTPGASRGGY
jgi:predicted phage terminase large subunit-like protein